MDSDRCWHNKFHPEYPQCPSLGTWFDPDAQSSVLGAMRWCDAHKHDYDIKIQEEHACEYGVVPCPQCRKDRAIGVER